MNMLWLMISGLAGSTLAASNNAADNCFATAYKCDSGAAWNNPCWLSGDTYTASGYCNYIPPGRKAKLILSYKSKNIIIRTTSYEDAESSYFTTPNQNVTAGFKIGTIHSVVGEPTAFIQYYGA